MKKRLMGLFLSLVLILALIPMTALAASDSVPSMSVSYNGKQVTSGKLTEGNKTIALNLTVTDVNSTYKISISVPEGYELKGTPSAYTAKKADKNKLSLSVKKDTDGYLLSVSQGTGYTVTTESSGESSESVGEAVIENETNGSVSVKVIVSAEFTKTGNTTSDENSSEEATVEETQESATTQTSTEAVAEPAQQTEQSATQTTEAAAVENTTGQTDPASAVTTTDPTAQVAENTTTETVEGTEAAAEQAAVEETTEAPAEEQEAEETAKITLMGFGVEDPVSTEIKDVKTEDVAVEEPLAEEEEDLFLTAAAPAITSGDLSWVKDSGKTLSVSADGKSSQLKAVNIDGSAVSESNYTVSSKSSTTVTFTAAYLNSLSVGVHTVSFSYTKDTAAVNLLIKQSPASTVSGGTTGTTTSTSGTNKGTTSTSANASKTTTSSTGSRVQTGDASQMALWIALIIMGAFAVASVPSAADRKLH